VAEVRLYGFRGNIAKETKMSSKKNGALDESVIASLIREADDKVFVAGKRIDYNEHLNFTARHIAQNYHVALRKATRKALADEKRKGVDGGPTKPLQKPQKRQDRASKGRVSTLPLSRIP